MTESFGTRLRARLDKYGPLCVGLDPGPDLLHAWGLDDSPAGLERFSRGVVDAVSDLAAVVKPQSAYYERWGSRGIAVLERTIADLRDAGPLVLLDANRGDTGGPMAAYAEAYLDRGSPLAADAVTFHPYFGFGSLAGAITSALASDAGVFVLARTGARLQEAAAGEIYEGVRAANADREPLGSVGVVVGASVADPGYPLDRLNGPVLVPGVEGSTPAEVGRVFGAARHAVLPSVSRALLGEQSGLRARTERYRDECVHHLSP